MTVADLIDPAQREALERMVATADPLREQLEEDGWHFRRGIGNPRVRVAEHRTGRRVFGATEAELLANLRWATRRRASADRDASTADQVSPAGRHDGNPDVMGVGAGTHRRVPLSHEIPKSGVLS